MYKLSHYNYVLPYNERYVYYNGISRQVFSLTISEHEKMQHLFHDLVAFEKEYPTVFAQFKDWGFVLENEIDEVNILKFRNRKDVYADRSYYLVVNPTLECNFKCWYCYEEHPKGHMTKEILGRLKKCIEYLVVNRRIDSLSLGWFGGEPLLYFDEIIYPLSLHAKQVCEVNHIPFYTSATTNASKINMEMVVKMKEIGMTSFQITIDGDEKRHDKIRNENGEPSFQKIMNNITLLCEHLPNIHITLRVNYDNQTLQQSDMSSIFKKIPAIYRPIIYVNFQRVWQTVEKSNNESVERKNLHELCRELGFRDGGISNSFMPDGFYKCYADRDNYAEINYDGKVYRCTARGYDDQYVMGELKEDGRIVWNEKKKAQNIGFSTFENEMCLACKYLPLCMGPCSQKLLETPKERWKNLCYLNYCEISPEDTIIDYYKHKMKVVKKMQMSEAKPQVV